jgi:hypothetical protein
VGVIRLPSLDFGFDFFKRWLYSAWVCVVDGSASPKTCGFFQYSKFLAPLPVFGLRGPRLGTVPPVLGPGLPDALNTFGSLRARREATVQPAPAVTHRGTLTRRPLAVFGAAPCDCGEIARRVAVLEPTAHDRACRAAVTSRQNSWRKYAFKRALIRSPLARRRIMDSTMALASLSILSNCRTTASSGLIC